MNNLPLWHDDVFACYPAMIERLKELVTDKTVKIIKEADDINDLVGDESKRLPLDDAIYVVFDSINPMGDTAGNGKYQVHEIGFSLVYTARKYSFRPLSGMSIGKILARISQKMNGFDPKNENGQDYTLSPFYQRNPLPVQYKNGFGYFSLRFVTTVATQADN